MLTEPPTDPPGGAGSGAPAPDPDPEPPRRGRHPVLGGVGLEIGRRLGIDPLWPRLAFVALTLAGGLGIVVYAGLWLLLVVGRRPGGRRSRVGGVAVLDRRRLLLDGGRPVADSPWMLAAVLVGVAVALWQPRGVRPAGPVVERTAAG